MITRDAPGQDLRINMKNLGFILHLLWGTKNRINSTLKKGEGFTLIEFLIYIAVLAVVLIFITGFLWDIILGNVKETSWQEVQYNSRFALTKISQEIKKATGVNSPLPGNSADSLSLIMADPNLNPTIFDITGGKLRITPGTSGPYEITSDQIIVTNLRFTNLSYPDTPGTIQIEITTEYINPANRIEYSASIDLKLSVSLISGGAAP